MNKLYCHTEMKHNGDILAVKGRTYDIVKESEWAYIFIDETLEYNFITKEPDGYGISYKEWFDLLGVTG